MDAPRFLLKTGLASVSPVLFQGQPAYQLYGRLIELLQGRGATAALRLFAEPVSGADAISWYGQGVGDPTPLPDLSAARRSEAEGRLRAALQDIAPLLDDPEAGPLLKRALVLPSADAIIALDDSIILAGWGLAPLGLGQDDASLARHIRDTLGRYSPALAAIDDRFFSAAIPAPAATQQQPAAVPKPAPSPVVAPSPVQAPPPRDQRRLPVIGLAALLGGVALLFLLLGFWAAWMHFTRDMADRRVTASIGDQASMREAIRVQRGTNDALQRELDRVRQAAAQPNVCTMDPLPGVSPSPDRQPIRPDAVPPAVPQQQGQAPQPFTGNLAQLLEHSTVMIVSAGSSGIGHGTGFFIAGDTVLTNAHVVEHADPQQIFVMSTSIGRAIPAQLVTMTRGTDGGDMQPGMPDFAIVRLSESVPGAQPLALTTTAEKLTDVVAAGYPASVVRLEEGMRELREGKLGTPPELVLTRGNISTIQRLESGLVVMPHSADISPGNSGGPLVDSCGRVVGINTFVSQSSAFADRVKYAEKVDSVLPWLAAHNIAVQANNEPCQPAPPSLPARPSLSDNGPAGPSSSPAGGSTAAPPGGPQSGPSGALPGVPPITPPGSQPGTPARPRRRDGRVRNGRRLAACGAIPARWTAWPKR